MPRYFFRLENGETLSDETGEMLADDGAARNAAVEILGEMLASKREHLGEGGRLQVLVSRETDINVFVITAEGSRLRDDEP